MQLIIKSYLVLRELMKKHLFSFIILLIVLITLLPGHQPSLRKYVLGPTSAHKIIYISEAFDSEELVLIQEAANEWYVETKGLVSFTIIYSFDYDIYQSIRHHENEMVMARAGIGDSLLDVLDANVSGIVLGYYLAELDTQTIILVPDRMRGRDYYRSVIMHEMGHSIGLSHLDVDNTIMVSSMDRAGNHLTKNDIEWFCRVYYCNYEDLGGIMIE